MFLHTDTSTNQVKCPIPCNLRTGTVVIHVIFSKKEISPLPLSTRGKKKKILIKLRQTLMWEKLLPWANGHKTSKENERKYRIGPWRKEQLRCSQRENSDLIFYEPKCPNSNSDLIFLLLYTNIFSLRIEKFYAKSERWKSVKVLQWTSDQNFLSRALKCHRRQASGAATDIC